MLHSEDALAGLRQCLSDLELKYDIESLSSKSIKLKVYVNDSVVNAWFDTQNQYYAFSLFQGGYKSYNTIEEFGTKLNIYLKVNVDFLPKAKAAANQFEAIHGLTTVYDNFSGNLEVGFTATFRVLGKDNYILMVERKNSNYRVLLGELNPEDKSKCRLLSEYVYDFDETGKIGIIPNTYYYADRIAATYDKNDVVRYKRIGVDSYTFQVENTRFTLKVIFSYKTIMYQVSEINGRECQLTIKDLPSPFRIEQVAMECKLHYDSLYPINEEPGVTLEESGKALEKAAQTLDEGIQRVNESSQEGGVSKAAVTQDVVPKPAVKDAVEKPPVRDMLPQDMSEEIPLFDEGGNTAEGGTEISTDSGQDLMSPEVQTAESATEAQEQEVETTEFPAQGVATGVETAESTTETANEVIQDSDDTPQTSNDEQETRNDVQETSEVVTQTEEAVQENTESSDEVTEVSDETTEVPGEVTEVSDENAELPDETSELLHESTEIAGEAVNGAEGASEQTTESENQTIEDSDSSTDTNEEPQHIDESDITPDSSVDGTKDVSVETENLEQQTVEVHEHTEEVPEEILSSDETVPVQTEESHTPISEVQQPDEAPADIGSEGVSESEPATEPISQESSESDIGGEKPMENPVASNNPVVPDKIVEVWTQPDDPLVKVVLLDSKPVYLQFNVDKVFYNVSIEVADSLGLPLSIVDEEVKLIRNRGVFLTEDEKKARSFAKDVTQDEAMCQKLVGMLFD